MNDENNLQKTGQDSNTQKPYLNNESQDVNAQKVGINNKSLDSNTQKTGLHIERRDVNGQQAIEKTDGQLVIEGTANPADLKKSNKRKIIWRAINIAVVVGIGIFLVYFLLKQVNFNDVKKAFLNMV